MSNVSHLPGYNNLHEKTNHFIDSRSPEEQRLPVIEQYQHLADAWDVDVETLYPETFTTLTAKANEFEAYVEDPESRRVPENPIPADAVISGNAASWTKALNAWHAAKAAAAFPTAKAQQTIYEVRHKAAESLQSEESFTHILEVLDIPKAVEELRQAYEERQATGPLSDNVDEVREKWAKAFRRILWIDAVVPEDMKASIFTGVTELPELRQVRNRIKRETVTLYSAEDLAEHGQVNEWRSAYSHVRDRFTGVSAKDNAILWLLSGDLQLPLSIASSWDELSQRTACFHAAGKKITEDFQE